MERLTIKTVDGDICYEVKKDPEGAYDILDLAKHVDDGDGEEANILVDISNRLAEYEDSGLSPEDVRKLVLPVKIGDKVKVDVRALPWNYLHPADRCGDFADCEVIGFAKTKKQTFMKLVALYPSRMNRRGYLRYSIGAIGKTVFRD